MFNQIAIKMFVFLVCIDDFLSDVQKVWYKYI